MSSNFLKGLLSSLAIFDFVSYKPKLLYKGKSNFQSSIGGFISILTICFLLAFGIYFFTQLFQRKNMNITSNDKVVEWPIYNMSNMPFIFKLVDGNGYEIANDSSIFVLQGLVSSNRPFNYYLEPCDINNVKHFGEYRKYFEDVRNLEKFNCIDDLNKYNFSLYGTYTNNELPKSFINIILNICKNSTENKNAPCKTRAAIDTILSSVYLNLIYLEHKIDHNNFNDPGYFTISTEILSFSATIYKRYNFFYSLIEYETDEGFVFPQNLITTYFKKQRIDVSVDLRVQVTGNVKFGQICLFLSKDQTNYFRKYIKVQDVIASIGGVLSSVLFLANLILYHVSRRLFLIRLANDSYVSKEKDYKRLISRRVLDKEFQEINSENQSKAKYLENSVDFSKEQRKSHCLVDSKDNKEIYFDDSFSIPDENTEKFNIYVDRFSKNINTPDENKQELIEIQKCSPEEGGREKLKNAAPEDNKSKEILNKKKFEKTFCNTTTRKEDIQILPAKAKMVFEIESNEPKIHTNNLFSPDLEYSLNEKGKLKEDLRNIFWPSKSVKKLYDHIENRSGLDSTLNYCSQIEKMKKFLFSTKEEINLFNNLPDLDIEEILEGSAKSEEHLNDLILKIKEKNPDTKLMKMIKNF